MKRWLVLGCVALALGAGWWLSRSGLAATDAAREEGVRLLRQHKPAEARSRFLRCLADDPADTRARKFLVEIAVNEKNWDEALAHLDVLTGLCPDDAGVWTLRGRIHGEFQRRDEALADYLRALELTPDDSEARLKACLLAAELGRYDVSDSLFERVLAAKVGDRDTLGIRYARTFWDRGDGEGAWAVLDRWVSRPGPPTAQVIRGLIEFKRGRMAEAVVLLRDAKPTESNERSAAMYHLAMAYEHLGRADEARACHEQLRRFERAFQLGKDAELRPRDHDFRLRAARELASVGLYEDAAKLLDPIARHPLMDAPENRKLLEECRAAQRKAGGQPAPATGFVHFTGPRQ